MDYEMQADYSNGVFISYTVGQREFDCTTQGFQEFWRALEEVFWWIIVVIGNIIFQFAATAKGKEIWSMVKDLMFGTTNWAYFSAAAFYLVQNFERPTAT